jgi:hypothetical protein
MKIQADAPCGPIPGDHGLARSMTTRFAGALLVQALVAGFLISTFLYPPAAVGVLFASIALAACLGRAVWGDVDR